MNLPELCNLMLPRWLPKGFFYKFSPSHQTSSPKQTRCSTQLGRRLIWHENHTLGMIMRHWKKICRDNIADRYEDIKQNDIAIINAADDNEMAFQIETALRKFCPNVRIMKSENVIPGVSLFSFYEKMINNSSFFILILSKNFICNDFFSIIASEIVTTNKIAYFNLDNSYKEHNTWSWIVRDVVTKGDVTDLENWARKLVSLLEKKEIFIERIKRETASVNQELKRISVFAS